MKRLSDLWSYFADTSCGSYSPLYDRICRVVAQDDGLLEVVEQAPPQAHLPNVLLAAVHFLVLGGAEHPLSAVYAGSSVADPGPLFLDFCSTHREELLELLAVRHTNTNEVGRSAVIGPALSVLTERFGEPIGLVDVGCSAGLNLFCDRYLLDYGAYGVTGPADSSVRIPCEVIGGAPPIASSLGPIESRVGLDLDPVDVSVPENLRWQLACVWPDTGRLDRTRTALEMLAREPPRIVEGDAVERVGDLVLEVEPDVLATVVTTWSMAYLRPERRLAFAEALRIASFERTVAWIIGEGAGVVGLLETQDNKRPEVVEGVKPSVLGSVVFRDGALETIPLGLAHPHGSWIDWQGP